VVDAVAAALAAPVGLVAADRVRPVPVGSALAARERLRQDPAALAAVLEEARVRQAAQAAVEADS